MDMNGVIAMRIFLSVITLVACIWLLISTLRTFYEADKRAEAEIEFIDANEEEFSFYLDGVEVEYDNISLEQYNMDYDLDSKKVFLTKRAGRNF